MTSAIEERVVEMKFNNQEFERNVNTSINTIDKLKAALDFRGAAKGMDEISKAADKVDMSNIVSGIEAVKVKFDALQVAGFTVVQELTKAFLGFGKKLWDISFGQMKSGGMSRALKIEQANFKMKALLKNMDGIGDAEDKIKAKMDEIGDSIDRAVTGTAYGYDAAANVAAQLMASGMTDASKMYDYLRGIAGAAAMTGRSFEDIGQIFTTISSNGKLMTMQLRQFSSAGLNISAELARQMGKTEQQINEMVTKGEISFQQFAQAMYDAFGESAGKADETYAGVTTNIKAQLSRIGQVFAEPYIQNMIPALQKLKAMLVSLKNALIPVGKRFDTFMHTVSDWIGAFFESVDFSRLDNFVRGIENIFWGLALILAQVKEAFQEMFPPKSVDELNAAAVAFETFTEAIFPTKEALLGIRNIIKALLVPVQFLIKKVISIKTALQPVIISLVQLAYTIISIIGRIANIIVIMTEGARASNTFNTIIQMIGYTIASVIGVLNQFLVLIDQTIAAFAKSDVGNRFTALLKEVGDLITNLVCGALFLVIKLMTEIASKINAENLRKFINGITEAFSFLLNAIQFVIVSVINGFRVIAKGNTILGGLLDILKKIGTLIVGFFRGDNTAANLNAISASLSVLKERVKDLGNAIAEYLSGIDAKDLVFYAFVISIIATVWAIRGLISNLSLLTFNVAKTVNNVRLFTLSLSRMRDVATHAKMFIYFAGSIMLIVGALYELSMIPTDRLITSATILGGFAVALIAFSALMVVASKNLGMVAAENGTMMAVSRFMISFSGSLTLMAVAMRLLSDINMTAKQALQTIGIMLAIMAGMSTASILISNFAGRKLTSSTFGFIGFAIAVNILVKTISKISKEDLKLTWQNIAFLLGTIVAIGAAMSMVGRVRFGSAFVILAYAVLLKTVLSAFMSIASMPIETLNAGLERIYKVIEDFIPLIILGAVANRLAGRRGGFANMTSFMTSLAAFVLITSFVISSLARIDDPAKLEDAVKVIERLIKALSNAFAGITIIMGLVTYFTAGKTQTSMNELMVGKMKIQRVGSSLKGLAAIFIGLAAGVALLSIAIGLLAKSSAKPEELQRALGIVQAILWTLAGGISMILFFSMATKYTKMGPMLVAVTGAIGLFVGLFAAIAAIGVLPDGAIEKINDIWWKIALLMVAFTGILLAFALMGKWKKTEAVGLGDRQANAIEIVGVVIGILGFAAAIFAVVHEYVANIDKFSGDFWKDWGPLLAIIGAFSLMLVVFGVVTKLIETSEKKVKVDKSLLLRTAAIASMVTLMYGIVLGTFAALVHISGTMREGQASRIVAMSISIGVIIAALAGVYVLMANAVDTLPKEKANANSLLKMGAAMLVMASVFILLSGAIATISYATSISSDYGNVLTTLLVMMGIIALFAKILDMFGDKHYFNYKPEKIIAFAGGTALLASIFPIISSALIIIKDIRGVSALKRLIMLTSIVAVLGLALTACNRWGKDISVHNILAFSAGMLALSGTLVVISACLKMLGEVSIDAWRTFGILSLLETIIFTFSTLIWLMSLKSSATSNAGMVAFAISVSAFAVSLISIAYSIKIMSDALQQISVQELWDVITALGLLELAMAGILTLGAIAGGVTGGLASAVIIATAVAMLAMGASLYFAAGAIDKYSTAMIKLKDAGYTISDLINSLADGAEAIYSRIDDFGAAIFAVITAIASIIIAASPMIAASLAYAAVTAIGYITMAILMVGDSVLDALTLMLQMIADWMRYRGGDEAFYNLGFIIGNAVVNGILGAFEGLTGKMVEVAFNNGKDVNKDEPIIFSGDTRGRDAGESMRINHMRSLGVSRVTNGYMENGQLMPSLGQQLTDTGNDILRTRDKVLDFYDALDSGDTSGLDDVLSSINELTDKTTHFNDLLIEMSNNNDGLMFTLAGDKQYFVNAATGIGELGDATKELIEIKNQIDDAYANGIIDKSAYDQAILSIENSMATVHDQLKEYDDMRTRIANNEHNVSEFQNASKLTTYAASLLTGMPGLGIGKSIIDYIASGDAKAPLMIDYTHQMDELETYIRHLSDARTELDGLFDETTLDNLEYIDDFFEYIDNNSTVLTTAFKEGKIGLQEYSDEMVKLWRLFNKHQNDFSDFQFMNLQNQFSAFELNTSQSLSELSHQKVVDTLEPIFRKIGEKLGIVSNEEFTENFFEPGHNLAGGGGGHNAVNMISRMVPPKMIAKAGEDAGTQFTEAVEETVGESSKSTASEWFAGFKEDVSAWMQDVGIPEIDTSNAGASLMNYLNSLDAIPKELKTVLSLVVGVDTSSQEYLDLINEANFNLGGSERWRRQGYSSADEYARAHLEKNGDTFGFDRWMEEYGKYQEEMTKQLEETQNQAANAASGLSDYGDEAGKAAKETDHLADSVENALDIFSEFNVELDLTAKDVLKNFSSQLIGVSSWSQELQALAGRGLSSTLLQYLADMGPEAYDKVHALFTASASQLAMLSQMYEEKLLMEANTASDIRAAIERNKQNNIAALTVAGKQTEKVAEKVGEDLGEKMGDGIRAEMQQSVSEDTVENLTEIAQIGANAIEQGVIDAHKIGMEYEYINGVVIPSSIKDSIHKATPSVAAIFGEMGYQSMEAFKHYLNVEDAITMVEGFQETLKDSITSSLSIFDEVKEKEDISAEEMLNRMKENVKNVGKWANDLQSLAARGIDEGLLAQLQALGPEGADKVHAFTLMTDAQLRAANNAFGASAALPQQVADRITKSYAEAGYNTILGFVEGIDPTAAEEVMTALGTYSLAALEQALDINSPSEKTKKDGLYSVEGFCLGIEENLGSVAGSAVLMAETFCSVLEESMANYFAQKKMNGYDPTGIMSLDQIVRNDPAYLSGLKGDTTEMNGRRLQSVQVNVVPVLDNAKVIETVDNVKKMFDISKFNLMPTIGLAQATTAPMSQNRDYSPALKDISTALHSEKDEISAMRNDISMLQVAMAGMQVTLDGATVGKLMTPYVNKNLGVTYSRDKRRKF